MDKIFEMFAISLENKSIYSFIIAFVSGILTACMPCFLSTLPLVITYVTSNNNEKDKLKKHALVFVFGNILMFIVFGLLISIIGSVFSKIGKIYYIIIGSIMILMALQILEVINIIKPTYLITKNKKKGYIGAFIAGVLSGIFSSPCQTPVIVFLFSLVLEKGEILYGILLLLMYSIGSGIVIYLVISFMEFVKEIKNKKEYYILSKVINVILSIIMLLLGLYMFYLGF